MNAAGLRFPADPAWFHGQVSLQQDADGIRPWRLPYGEVELSTQAWWISWHLIQQAGESTGVRLRLRSDAPRLVLDCLPLPDRARTVDLVVGAQEPVTFTLEAGAGELAINGLPGEGTPFDIWLPHHAACTVRGIVVPDGCSLEPVADARRRLVVYGSSITHCQGAPSPARTWPAQVARAHDLALVSLGFSGQCHLHLPIARLLRDLDADFFILKIGISIFGSSSLNGVTFMPNLAGTVQLIRERHPRTPIALVSPIIHAKDEVGENVVGMSVPKFRLQIAETVERLGRITGDRHLLHVDGRDIFGVADAALHQPDGVHPDPEGMDIMARRINALVIPPLLALGAAT